MRDRTLGILVTAALAVPVSGCVFGTEGELQGGAFYYECSASQFDSVCADSLSRVSAVPTAVAVGASFGMMFQKNGKEDPSYSPFSASPEIIATQTGGPSGSAFHFQKPGYGAILARDALGNVADFVHLKALPLDHIDVQRETLKVTELTLKVGQTLVLKIQPKDSTDHELGGGFDLEWTSPGDGTTLELSPAPGSFGEVSHSIQVKALAAGKADLTAAAGGKNALVHITVTGG